MKHAESECPANEVNTAKKLIPKKGQKFNAIVNGYGHIAIGCPCICRAIHYKIIDAIDKDGNERVFDFANFSFKKVK